MVVLGVGSILGMTFFGVMYGQNLSYVQRLEELDAHQNARAALAIMRHAIQGARYGLGQGVGAGGVVPLGRCFDSGNPAASVGACNNVDGGADRLRAVALVNDANFVGDPGAGPSSCTGNSNSVIAVDNAPPLPFQPGSLVGIGGTCGPTGVVGSPPSAGDVMRVVGDAGAAAGCTHQYTFALLETGATQISCPGGYQRPFAFGDASVVDFYVAAPNGAASQGLYMNSNGGALASRQQLIAFNIEDLQVVYGIDTSEVPDHAYDAWCSDPRPSAVGGDCDLLDSAGNGIAATSLYNRIVALRLYVRVRSSTPHPSLLVNNPIGDPNYLALAVANPVVNPLDGYRRWLYGTVVNLRNNNP